MRLCLVVWPCSPLLAAEQTKPAAEILSPEEGAIVAADEQVQGRLHTRGFPVVLVRPLVGHEPWYVQPEVTLAKQRRFSGQVFFGNDTTPPGTQFRVAVLVARSRKQAARRFKLGATFDALPPEIPRSPFVTVVRDREAAPVSGNVSQDRLLVFGGQPWAVKCGGPLGPGPNTFSDSTQNVWLHDEGHLHLAITKHDDQWTSAELIGPPLGYGQYRWVVAGRLGRLDPNAVLGLFLYADPGPGRTERELDFELSRWGDPQKPNAQFVVQPFVDREMRRFDTGSAQLITVDLTWEEGAA